LVVLSNANAQSFLSSYSAKDNQGKVNKLYSAPQLKALLSSNRVACFSFNRKAYLSKGYIAKLGKTKSFCTAKASKMYGIKRLNKDNLTLNFRIKLTKAL